MMKFFSLGASELMLVIMFALLAVGPKETARLVGEARKIIQSIQGTLSELTGEVARVASDLPDIVEEINETKQAK